MIRIEVESTSVDERHGISAKNKPWTMREQKVYAHVLEESGKPAKYPVKCKVLLEENQSPYQPGFYTIDPRSIQVGEYEALGFERMKLVPAAPAVAK